MDYRLYDYESATGCVIALAVTLINNIQSNPTMSEQMRNQLLRYYRALRFLNNAKQSDNMCRQCYCIRDTNDTQVSVGMYPGGSQTACAPANKSQRQQAACPRPQSPRQQSPCPPANLNQTMDCSPRQQAACPRPQSPRQQAICPPTNLNQTVDCSTRQQSASPRPQSPRQQSPCPPANLNQTMACSPRQQSPRSSTACPIVSTSKASLLPTRSQPRCPPSQRPLSRIPSRQGCAPPSGRSGIPTSTQISGGLRRTGSQINTSRISQPRQAGFSGGARQTTNACPPKPCPPDPCAPEPKVKISKRKDNKGNFVMEMRAQEKLPNGTIVETNTSVTGPDECTVEKAFNMSRTR